MSELIKVSVDGPIQTIRFSRREKMNALNGEMYAALCAAFAESEEDPDIRVRVLLGSEGVFTAGNDIADFIEVNNRGDEVMAPVLGFLRALIFTDKPLVAAVDGLAVGIGTTMLFHCDLTYATAESVFITPFIDLGLVPEAGSSLIAPQRMGYTAAFAMLVSGKALKGDEAVRARIINTLVPRANLEEHAISRAAKLAGKPPRAMTLSRRLMRGDPNFIWQRVEEEAALFRECLISEEARIAFEAFVHKSSSGAAGKPGH